MGRTIIHADLDAFYASVEQLDNPQLRGKPVAVGGAPESRGVVMTASYEARRFGVRSAMPMSRAMRLCPQLQRVSPRFGRYSDLSRVVMGIFRSVTPLVEPLSLDEAFLDVTGRHAEYGGVKGLGAYLKREVRRETGLTVSIGIATNKTVAKIASDKGKPDGLFIVPPGTEARFLAPLSVRSLWGVGPKTEQAFIRAGYRTVGDIARSTPHQLEAVFGRRGRDLWEMASGRDDRPVEPHRERKSIGSETTFPCDLRDGPELREHLSRLAEDVAQTLRVKGMLARTITVKLRYANFRTITRRSSRPEPTDDAEVVRSTAAMLLDNVTEEGDRFRLLGVQVSNLTFRQETRGHTPPSVEMQTLTLSGWDD